MIQEILTDNIGDIKPLIEQYTAQAEEGSFPENFSELLKTAITDGKACVYGAYAEDGSVKGLASFGKVSKRISFVYASRDLDTEKRLTRTLFDRFTKEFSYMSTRGPWLSKDLAKYILDIGFVRFDRMVMTLPRVNVESLAEPQLPEGMEFDSYVKEIRDEICKIIYEGNVGQLDQNVFPDFFGSVDTCRHMLESIESSRFGEYRDSSSWILKHNDNPIGACFMTIRNGDMGYIPDIVINKNYRGQGLGRAILVHSMKRLLESDAAIIKVNLDVTLSNDARFLYKSLGFTKVREYTMYTWMK